MKLLKLFILLMISLLLKNIYGAQAAGPEPKNYVAQAQDFLKKNQITPDEELKFAQSTKQLFETLKKLGKIEAKFANKKAFQALGQNFQGTFEKLKGPMTDFLIQLQTYYNVFKDDLKTKNVKNDLPELSLK